MEKGVLGTVALLLVLVGALNWGLVGVVNFNLVEFLLGSFPMVVRAVYIVVGVAAVIYAYVALLGSK
jgi:uncharacterized membrane protein YuzA (DUF378 family)